MELKKSKLASLLFAGLFVFECYDRNGNLKWKKTAKNGTTNQGLDYGLDVIFGAEAKPTWYVGLIRDDSYSGLSAADTMASHAGWVEVTAYDEAVRQTLTLGAVSGKSVDNSASKATFTISVNDTVIGGAFITTTNDKGGSTGILYGVGAFTAGDKTIDDNDTLEVTVTLTAAAA